MLTERKPNVDRGSSSVPPGLRAPGVVKVFVANSKGTMLREEDAWQTNRL